MLMTLLSILEVMGHLASGGNLKSLQKLSLILGVQWSGEWQVAFNAGKTRLVSFGHSVDSGGIDIGMGEKMLEEESSF